MSNQLNNETSVDDYEHQDEMYKKIVTQIDDEERLHSLVNEMKEFTEYLIIPLLQNLNMEKLSDFITPSRVRVF